MIEFSRHDNHNVELKSSAMSGNGIKKSVSQLQLYLFVPKSMQLSTYPKSSLIHDFSSRVRLSLPEECTAASMRTQRLVSDEIARLEQLLKQHAEIQDTDAKEPIESEIFVHVRHLGAVLSEKIKSAAGSHSRELFLAHSLLAPPENCATEVGRVTERMTELLGQASALRDLLASMPSAQPLSAVHLLDHFVHDLIVDYLASLKKQLEFVQTLADRFDGPDYESAIRSLREKLVTFGRCEATRKIQPANVSPEAEAELRLYRSSQLKKFFQSEMFIDVTKQETTRRITEPAAILGASISAFSALGLEHMAKHGNVFLGLGGVSVAVGGIFMYVFKDRLKDRGKNYFLKKIGGRISDFSQDLVLRKRKIGKIHEHFSVKSKGALPESIRAIRDAHAMTDAEKHVAEEVLTFSRYLELSSEDLQETAPGAILREVWRLNLARYLKHMDDVYKEVPVLTSEGELEMVRSHRLYYFYVILTQASASIEKSRLRKLSPEAALSKADPSVAIYRLALDKKGIQRIELLSGQAQPEAARKNEALGLPKASTPLRAPDNLSILVGAAPPYLVP